ncbi:MAG: GvpL/GvpF family gas vesicle protein [Syntrophaceae bacterium]|nr:GvpL/GvpF family gas vesicle protein [Syntrophaceae bacterium]
MTQAYYLFCFARNDFIGDSVSGFGLTKESELFKIKIKDLALIVSKVSLEEFAGPGSDERLNNVEWITPRALRHGQVVQEISERSPVLPASFGTLFSSEENLISLAESNYEVILDFFYLLENRQEWAVKLYLDRDRLKKVFFKKRVGETETELSKLSPGVRYFKEKQIQAAIEKDIISWVNSEIAKLERQLKSISENLKSRKSNKTVFDENEQELVSNWAILVDSSGLEKLEYFASMTNCDPYLDGLTIRISGPWPPYSFAPVLEMESKE